MQSILRKVDLIILIVIALVAGILSILDFFNIFESYTPNYPVFTLFLLGMIGLHLIVSHFSQEDFRDSTGTTLKKISEGIVASDFRQYKDSMEIESRLAKRILEAHTSVCDLTWKVKISEGFSAKDRQMAHTFMDKCIAEASERISYREVFVFSDPRRVDKLNRRLEEEKSGYSCRYFREDSQIPRIQFVIIDDSEVFFFASSSDSMLCSFASIELVKVFKSYYEAVWNAASPIKTGPDINEKEVESIREKYGQSRRCKDRHSDED